MSARRFPLQGVTVLDLGQIYNGPYATFLMAMAGARVIKIEPREGESLRQRTLIGGAALPFAMLNSNKEAITLNLKTARGRALLIEMAKRADVVLENFVPGKLDKLGVGYEALRKHNPRIIYASGSGYGRTGPYREYPAMDITIQAMAGIMSVTGFPDDPPTKAGPAMCDFSGGIHLYGAVTTALYERERTGEGQLVEVAMFEAVYASLASSLGRLGQLRRARHRPAAYRQRPQRRRGGALYDLQDARRLCRHSVHEQYALEISGKGDGPTRSRCGRAIRHAEKAGA
jgi:CoA:oxalate CoA-transferase